MPSSDLNLGKKAEAKIELWLDHPELGYSFDRIPDQMTGYYMVSRNICDFICFKSPYQYYIESKATWKDRFDFVNISDTQREGLYEKSKIENCFGLIMLLFAAYQRVFILDIRDIKYLMDSGIKSLNIKKLDKWKIPFVEIDTVPNSRKELLDYEGDFESYVYELEDRRINETTN